MLRHKALRTASDIARLFQIRWPFRPKQLSTWLYPLRRWLAGFSPGIKNLGVPCTDYPGQHILSVALFSVTFAPRLNCSGDVLCPIGDYVNLALL